MVGVVDIFNLALSAVGAKASISLPTEQSREAELCNLWYPHVRAAVLAAAPWPSTRATARLALIKERDPDVAWTPGDPEPGWRFVYQPPSNILRPRYLSSYERFEYAAADDGTRLIFSHVQNAILIYTRDQENIATWDAELRMAIVYALAAHLAMPLQGKDKRAEGLLDRANFFILNARIGAGHSDTTLEDNIPDWIRARGYGFTPSTRYVYPFGPLISLSEGIGAG